MPDTSHWITLPRTPLISFDRAHAPDGPGVYVVFRDDVPVFVGKAAHLGIAISQALHATPVAVAPPLRCAAAEFLGIASAASVRTGRFRPTAEDGARITAWIRSCQVAWKESPSESDAVRLEGEARAELDR